MPWRGGKKRTHPLIWPVFTENPLGARPDAGDTATEMVKDAPEETGYKQVRVIPGGAGGWIGSRGKRLVLLVGEGVPVSDSLSQEGTLEWTPESRRPETCLLLHGGAEPARGRGQTGERVPGPSSAPASPAPQPWAGN